MTIDEILPAVTGFCSDYPWVAGVVLVVVAVYVYREPKEALKLGAMLFFLLVALYFLAQFRETTSSGVDKKEELTRKTRDAAGE